MSSSLADELAADLLEDQTQGGNIEKDESVSSMFHISDASMRDANGAHAHGASQPPDELNQAQLDAWDVGQSSISDVSSISKLYGSKSLSELLQLIDKQTHQRQQQQQQQPEKSYGGLERSEDYYLIVRANNTAVEIDNELLLLHKFIRERYAPRFPELETLVLNPWEFIRAVRALGNGRELVCKGLEGTMPQGTIVVISMTASTTSGQPLSAEEWQRVQDACDMAENLEQIREKILSYVESHMTLLAPNLSALVGTRIATKLIGVTGGLSSFSKIPSCNIHLLGASKTGTSGLSSIHGGSTRFSGYLAQCSLVAQTPEEYRMQALRMVSAKASLAARMDLNSSSAHTATGQYGASLSEEISRKIEKLMEPPPAKLIKALPVPSEGGRKQRRGGRRARKFREMHGLTEMRKMQNRVEFGKEEEEAGAFDETMGLGMIHTKASGKVRATMANASSKARISKANKERLATLNRPTLSLQNSAPSLSSTSGTASSLSFTPVQGIELVDPSRQKKAEEANSKWFREGQFSLLPDAGKSTTATTIPQKRGASGMPPPGRPSRA